MKHLLLLLLSLSALSASAQNVILSGKISDANGLPVSFASVFIKNTTQGTSANPEGLYQLNLKPGKYELQVRAVGYGQRTQWVDLKANQQLNFTLENELYQLKDVVIRADAEDPAYAIIRQAIKKRKTYLNEVRAYEAQVYIKGMQKLLAAPKKFMGVDIDKMGQQMGLDSNRRGIIYLSESESKLSYLAPGQYREEMVSSKVSGSNRAFSFNRATDLKVNFYENFQNWEGLSMRPLVSPIAENAFLYYDYKFLGNTMENGEMINKIQVLPKRGTDPVFSGSMYILEDSWRIHSTDLYITKEANLNFVDTLKVKQEFFPAQKGIWMPSSVKMEFGGGFLGFRFGGYFVAVFKNYELEPALNKVNFKESLRITREVNKKDSVYWSESRPIPLTEEEQTDYKKKEVLAAKRESKPYLDSLDRENNKLKISKLLIGSGYSFRNRFERKTYRVNSLLGSAYYNTVEGFGLDYGASYTHRIDSLTNKFVNISGNLRYGFSNKQFNANMSADFPLGENYTMGLRLGSDILDLNNRGSIQTLYNSINSLFYEKNQLKLYQKQYINATISRRVLGNIRTTLTVEYANRKSLANATDYTFIDYKNRAFTSNNPFTPEIETPLFPENQALKLGFRATYNFSSRYVTYPTGKFYTASKYPTLGIQYNKGIRGAFGSDVDYDLISVDLAKSDIPMGFYGKTSFSLAAGKFLNNQSIFYTDFKHFQGNRNTFFEAKANGFLFLDFYANSTPDQFFEGHLEHDFSGFILNKIPLIRKLKLREIAGFNYLSTPLQKNYTEWYAGLQWLNFKVLYGSSNAQGNLTNRGIRVAIGL